MAEAGGHHATGRGGASMKGLILKTLLITPSGAMSPGPLSTYAVAAGAVYGPVAGLLMAIGHTIAELPYVYVLVKSVERVRPYVERWKAPLNAIVSVFLLWFAYLLLVDALRGIGSSGGLSSLAFSPLVAGIVLTAFNPYFLAWWATVGYPLIKDSASLGSRGLGVMYVSHVWMDYVWLLALAAGGGASRLLGETVYRGLLAVLALILVYFASEMIVDAVKDRLRRRASN